MPASLARGLSPRLGGNCYNGNMTITERVLASGPGWRVADVICTAGPADRPFEERHEHASIALVTRGSFQYRTSQGSAVLAPGSLLLGNAGACFECGHEHAAGDRCIAFQFAPDHLDAVAAETPEARSTGFAVPRLPPHPAQMPLAAAAVAEAGREEPDPGALEELALRLAGAVAAALAGAPRAPLRLSARDERRVTEVLRRIERGAEEALPLHRLARQAGMSPYHFLRVFRASVGMTPHQFVLRTRLQRAALRLRRSDDPVSTIAYDAGFNDLSTFNRRFKRIMGASPREWRSVRR
jgi:AraC family transcriptional regulator